MTRQGLAPSIKMNTRFIGNTHICRTCCSDNFEGFCVKPGVVLASIRTTSIDGWFGWCFLSCSNTGKEWRWRLVTYGSVVCIFITYILRPPAWHNHFFLCFYFILPPLSTTPSWFNNNTRVKYLFDHFQKKSVSAWRGVVDTCEQKNTHLNICPHTLSECVCDDYFNSLFLIVGKSEN